MKKFSIAPLFLAPFLACGGGGGGGHITVDGHTGSGSGSGSGSAAPCTASPTYGSDFGSAGDQFADWDGSAAATHPPASFERWGGALNHDTAPDLIQVELYKGPGDFPTAITTGTFQITGDDTNYKTCDVCVRIFGDATMTSADDYMATSGVVTITSLGGSGSGSGSDRTYGTFAGSVQNLHFDHVTIGSDFTSTIVGDCSSTIAAGNFSATLQYGGSAATPPVAHPALHVHSDRALRHRYN